MKSSHLKRICYIPFTLMFIYILGCSPAIQVSKARTPEKHRTYFGESYERREGKIYPGNLTNKFIKGDGKRVCVFTEWFDLIPSAKYVIRWEWYGPRGQIVGSKSLEFTPKESHSTSVGSLYLDHKWKRQNGVWSVKLYVNDFFISEERCLIADNETELAKLELEVKTQDDTRQEQDIAREGLHHPKELGQRWAVIIGISNYRDTRIPSLRYASADAQSVYDWLISADGGRYAPSRIKLLINQSATGKNIKNALFVWLQQALEEDCVTIYFAGHGSPESPHTLSNLFLLPYDSQYEDIATTGFPMWDIETALERFIRARKVVVVADACHAGGVGQAFDIARRATRGIKMNPISSGLQDLSKIGDGVCVISASDDKEFSQEGMKWGGGHGVFTYFLLKGLGGAADYSKDGRVTLGELIPFLSEQVRRATRNAQSPTVAGKFDPALSIGK